MIEVKDDEIILSAEPTQETAPEGRHPAICIDVIPLGKEEEVWNDRPTMTDKVALVWQVFPESGERQSTGAPFQIDVKVTASLNTGARLRLMLESWRGRPFTVEELKGFSLTKLKGVPCYLNVLHKVHNGNIYANLEDAMREDDPQQRKFGKVEPCLNGVAARLKAELEHYERASVIRRYERMRERRVVAASASASSIPQPVSADDDKSNWVPF